MDADEDEDDEEVVDVEEDEGEVSVVAPLAPQPDITSIIDNIKMSRSISFLALNMVGLSPLFCK